MAIDPIEQFQQSIHIVGAASPPYSLIAPRSQQRKSAVQSENFPSRVNAAEIGDRMEVRGRSISVSSLSKSRIQGMLPDSSQHHLKDLLPSGEKMLSVELSKNEKQKPNASVNKPHTNEDSIREPVMVQLPPISHFIKLAGSCQEPLSDWPLSQNTRSVQIEPLLPTIQAIGEKEITSWSAKLPTNHSEDVASYANGETKEELSIAEVGGKHYKTHYATEQLQSIHPAQSANANSNQQQLQILNLNQHDQNLQQRRQEQREFEHHQHEYKEYRRMCDLEQRRIQEQLNEESRRWLLEEDNRQRQYETQKTKETVMEEKLQFPIPPITERQRQYYAAESMMYQPSVDPHTAGVQSMQPPSYISYPQPYQSQTLHGLQYMQRHGVAPSPAARTYPSLSYSSNFPQMPTISSAVNQIAVTSLSALSPPPQAVASDPMMFPLAAPPFPSIPPFPSASQLRMPSAAFASGYPRVFAPSFSFPYSPATSLTFKNQKCGEILATDIHSISGSSTISSVREFHAYDGRDMTGFSNPKPMLPDFANATDGSHGDSFTGLPLNSRPFKITKSLMATPPVSGSINPRRKHSFLMGTRNTLSQHSKRTLSERESIKFIDRMRDYHRAFELEDRSQTAWAEWKQKCTEQFRKVGKPRKLGRPRKIPPEQTSEIERSEREAQELRALQEITAAEGAELARKLRITRESRETIERQIEYESQFINEKQLKQLKKTAQLPTSVHERSHVISLTDPANSRNVVQTNVRKNEDIHESHDYQNIRRTSESQGNIVVKAEPMKEENLTKTETSGEQT